MGRVPCIKTVNLHGKKHIVCRGHSEKRSNVENRAAERKAALEMIKREKTAMKKVFFDMDGTLTEWRKVRSEEELYRKGYFRSLRPSRNVIESARTLQNSGVDVYVLSCVLTDSPYALKEKKEWLLEHIPFIPRTHWIFVPCGEKKTRVVRQIMELEQLTENEVLVDDFSENLRDWSGEHGLGIKLMNGINGTKGTWQGLRVWAGNALWQLPVLLRVRRAAA